MNPNRVLTLPRIGAGLAAMLAGGAALGHPHHGASATLGFFEALQHLLTEPDHVALLVLALVAGIGGVRTWRARRAAQRDTPQDRR